MTVLLGIVPETLGPRPVSSAVQTRPAVGGVRQRKARLGSHFRMVGKFPPLVMADGRAHVADILRCETDTASLLVPQPDLVIGTPGATLVNGNTSAGNILQVDGVTPGYVFRKGQYFNHVTAIRRYLYMVTAEFTSVTGSATLSIWPMLRVAAVDNQVLDFATPRIEGWLEIGGGWEVTPDFTTETEFDIEEAA